MALKVPYRGMPEPNHNPPKGRAECPYCDRLVPTVLARDPEIPSDVWGCPRFVNKYEAHIDLGSRACPGSKAIVAWADVLVTARPIPRRPNPAQFYGAA